MTFDVESVPGYLRYWSHVLFMLVIVNKTFIIIIILIIVNIGILIHFILMALNIILWRYF